MDVFSAVLFEAGSHSVVCTVLDQLPSLIAAMWTDDIILLGLMQETVQVVSQLRLILKRAELKLNGRRVRWVYPDGEGLDGRERLRDVCSLIGRSFTAAQRLEGGLDPFLKSTTDSRTRKNESTQSAVYKSPCISALRDETTHKYMHDLTA